MALMLKNEKSFINVTPFVDVMMFLFVIILVISNFSDFDEETFKKFTSEIEMQKKEIFEKDKTIKELSQKLKIEVPVAKKIKQEIVPALQTPFKKESVDDTKNLKDEIERLKKELEKKPKVKNTGKSNIQIQFFDNGLIKANDRAIEYRDLIKMLKYIALDINMEYTTDEYSQGYSNMQKFRNEASQFGYEFDR